MAQAGKGTERLTDKNRQAALKAIQEVDKAYAKRSEADNAIQQAIIQATTLSDKEAQDANDLNERMGQFLASIACW